ncbi:MAG: choice-of-anchor D domain-containing protein [Terriglobales bacterium]
MIRRIAVLLSVLTTMLLVFTISSLAQSQSLLTRHTRDEVINGEATSLGRLPATESMKLDLMLALRHQPELENFLKDLYDPTSPSYRHFLTVEDFTARFGPGQDEYDAVVRFAKANGLQVTGNRARNRILVQVSGTVASIEKAFHVQLGLYQHPTENRTFYAPDREPSVDLPFQLWHISGLDNYSIPHPMIEKRPSQPGKTQPKPAGAHDNATTGSCPSASFCGSDMRGAYYEGASLTGAGQSLGLFEFVGTDLADLSTYYTNAKQTLNVPVTLLSVDGTPTSCLAAQGCDDTEQTLDMTQALGMAPNMSSLVMYIGSSDSAIFNGMATASPLNAQLSCSWGWSPVDPKTDDPIFQEFSAQGQNLFAAAGDSGVWRGNGAWPADDDYLVSVGGTDLTTQSAGGPWASETAWSDGGGGISPDKFPIPYWQVAAAAGCSGCSQTYRNGPDVSANANFTFYVCADQDGCTANDYGGTSFAAPMWAGYLALANQQAVLNGNPALGFINPEIYSIGLSSSYTTDFHDITQGNNGDGAGPGFDLASGWGSPNDSGLINSLAGKFFTLTPNPYILSIPQGGSNTSAITVSTVNGFSGSVTLSATGLPSGVSASFNPNPATTTSTLILTATAGATLGETTIFVNGTSGSLSTETGIQLTVAGAAQAVLSPTSVVFANEVVGGTSAAKTVTLSNPGNATLNIGGIATSGDFAVASKTCGATLAVGAKCTIKVTFNPTQLGTRTGSLSVTDNAAGSPQSVSLSGTGTTDAALTPAKASFPKTAVGSQSAAKTFTLSNKESVALTGVSPSTTGNFSISATTCGSSLAAKSKCTISVVFKPTETGVQTGTLQVNDSAFGSPQVSTLTGTGK